MMFANPKLTNGKGIHRKPVWIFVFFGPSDIDALYKLEILLGWRPDLMHPQTDRYKRIPCVWGLQIKWYDKVLREAWGKLGLNLRTRSNVGEIARRLAGGDV
jgi:hypothetical protein